MKNKESYSVDELYEHMLQGDPFARLLVEHRVSPRMLAVFAFLFGLLYVVVLPFFFGRLPQALNDWPTLVIVLIAFPLIMAYYYWDLSKIRALFLSLQEQTSRKMVEKGAGSIPFSNMFARPLWFWIAIVLGLLQSIYIYADTMYYRSGWQSVHPIMPAVLIPMRFLSFYGLIFIVARQVLTIRSLNRYLDIYPIDALVLPLGQPSGLYVLAPYALSTGMFIGVVGLILGMTLLNVYNGVERMTAEFIIDLVIYATVAPVLFLLPLWKAHNLILEAKNNLLNELEISTKKQYAVSLTSLRSGRMNADDADRLGALEQFYELTRKIPTWPFNLQTISKFGVAIILPLIVPLLLDVLTNLVAGWLLTF